MIVRQAIKKIMDTILEKPIESKDPQPEAPQSQGQKSQHKYARLVIGGLFSVILLAGIGVALRGYFLNESFIDDTRPIVIGIAEIVNAIAVRQLSAYTYGELKDLHAENIKTVENAQERLMTVTPKTKSANRLFSELNGILFMSKNYFSDYLRYVRYSIDNITAAQEIEHSGLPDNSSAQISSRQNYDEKEKMIESMRDSQLPQSRQALMNRSAVFLRDNQTKYDYDLMALFPVLDRAKIMQDELRKEADTPIEIQPRESGSVRYVSMVDAIRAFAMLRQMARASDDDYTNANTTLKHVQRINAADRLMERSRFEHPLGVSEKMIEMFTPMTATIRESMEKLIAALEGKMDEAEIDVDDMTVKSDAAWNGIFMSSVMLGFLAVDSTDAGTFLAISVSEGERVISTIEDEFPDEISDYIQNEGYISNDYDGLREPSYGGILMIYGNLYEFLISAKLKDQNVDVTDMAWYDMKRLGIYRNATEFEKFTIREVYYGNFMQEHGKDIPEDEKDSHKGKFIKEHSL